MLRFLLPSISWGILILLLYAIPGTDLPSMTIWDVFGADKMMHALMFSLFVTIMIVGFRRQNVSRALRNRATWLALGIGICYGILMESIQGMVFVERTTDILDMVANCAGALLGIVIFRIIYGSTAFA
ncbi:MAG: VanZ family protein [Flavobacteriales bacterium]|nr:VanZ family protein [Flavobacteriales bacterium]